MGSLYPDFAALRHSEGLKEVVASTGAVAMGRRTYDMAGGGDWSDYEFRVRSSSRRTARRPGPTKDVTSPSSPTGSRA